MEPDDRHGYLSARTRAGLLLRRLAGLAVDLRRIEHLVGVAEVEDQAAEVGLLERHRAIEAADPAGVAGAGADLLDPHPQCVLVAVDPPLDHPPGVSRAFALPSPLPAPTAVG